MKELFQRLVQRNALRTEAEIQADVRQFILSAPFELEDRDVSVVTLEAQVGKRQRIDVEVGATVIEVKRDLRKGKVKQEAIEQLSSYVDLRTSQSGLRYVGVLTDGTEWNAFHLVGGTLNLVSTAEFASGEHELERLTVWLEGVLATAHGIPPTAENIQQRLGATSSAYALDRSTIAILYQQNKQNPSVQMKRALWSRLLTSALGTQFTDTDDLFVEHTLLVNTAEVIAHAVVGLDVGSLSPASLLSGDKFDESGIHGVVESDFFDWVIEVSEGERFVRTLAMRLGRFEWGAVEEDVLKVLYESVIGSATRKQLGEYYTPDWLAAIIVQTQITNPLDTRVLDPACGSGTFLFHAVRLYLEAAENAGMTIAEALHGVTRRVVGMDLHPVAVTLARVTYLLAIGRNRLTNPDRETLQIPIYLGDSLQWEEQHSDLWAAGNLRVQIDDDLELIASELLFPDALLDNAAVFDQLVSEMADRAASRRPGTTYPSLNSVFQRLAIPDQYRPTLQATFNIMCRLHDEGRDHIWGYFVRNLARPLWMARPQNRVDMLIGNPPWLAFRHMTEEMQVTFRRMCKERNLWAGAKVATHQDLSALFAIRAVEQYLKQDGGFAFVMPNAAVDRDHYGGFRKGHYGNGAGGLQIEFERSWDLRRVRPHFFPRAASVVFGRRATVALSLPLEAEVWTGKLPYSNCSWGQASASLTRSDGVVVRASLGAKSAYRPAFTQGAILAPRLMFMVERQVSSALGLPAGKVAVTSSRSVQEQKAWKSLPSMTGIVESQFLRPCYSGEQLLPFRLMEPSEVLLPITASGLMDDAQIGMYAGLDKWWSQAVATWNANRSSDKLTLRQQLDYQSKLRKQLPIPALRVVYNRAGMHAVAAKVKNSRGVIASGLYWASVASEEEADFLCAIINAGLTTELVRPLMSYGKDERDIHKHIWDLPIPQFDPAIACHIRLAELGAQLETLTATFTVDSDLHFSAQRRHVREALRKTDIGAEAEALVAKLLISSDD